MKRLIWSDEALAELRLLAVYGVVAGDIDAFAKKHGRSYRAVVDRLQRMKAVHARLTYEERMDVLKKGLSLNFAEPKFPSCPRYGGPDWIGEPVAPHKDSAA